MTIWLILYVQLSEVVGGTVLSKTLFCICKLRKELQKVQHITSLHFSTVFMGNV